jgi:3-dehydroquinate synthase
MHGRSARRKHELGHVQKRYGRSPARSLWSTTLASYCDVSVNAVEISGRGYKYQAIVGTGLLDRVGALIHERTTLVRLDCLKQSSPTNTPSTPNRANAVNARPAATCAVITDEHVGQLFAHRVLASLATANVGATLITIPAGEQSKTLAQVGNICEQMLAARLDRQSFVIGLGGGVIGDISGFVASVFLRGIPHVLVPTTLLAMVDSSIGGKCGVNTRTGKNLLGAIHQPSLVIDDVDTINNLPARELRSGFAEIVKHAVIADAEMIEVLRPDVAGDAPALQNMIERNIAIKAGFVAKDERDRTGERALLNFGHTIGHAIERAGNYKTFTHGEAISLGMVAAANISVRRAGLAEAGRQAIVHLLARFELPTRLPKELSREQIMGALQFDKKFEGGEVRFVVVPKLGSARLTDEVTMDDLREAVAQL